MASLLNSWPDLPTLKQLMPDRVEGQLPTIVQYAKKDWDLLPLPEISLSRQVCMPLKA
jgi:hypothetical protein